MKQFKHIVTLVQALTLFAAPCTVALQAQQQQPVSLLYSTNLPGIVGDFDGFALDTKRNRLVIAAEEHHTLEVFDAKTGAHLQSVPGVKTPHAMAYIADKDELFVADGGDYSCIVLSGAEFHPIARVGLIDGSVTGKTDSPDTGVYDSKKRIFYIGNGGKSANLPYSEIAAISVDTHQIVKKYRVEGINLEGMAVDDTRNLLYVDVRDKKQVAVVDLASGNVVNNWATPDLNLNTSLAFDAANNRVLVVGRKPGLFYAFDAATGKVMQQLSCADISDGMNWDPQSKRAYVMGSQGLSIIQQQDKDHYVEIARLPTNGGKTGLLNEQAKLLYIIHPKTTIDDAGLLVYRVNR